MIKDMYVDMDAVIVDLIPEAVKLHGRDGYVPTMWAFYEEDWGMSHEDFWAPMQDPEFWASLPRTPMYDYIEDLVGGFNNEDVFICSSPCPWVPRCAEGKNEWLRRNGIKAETIYTSVKHKLARETALLIDDNERTIDKWEKAGGFGILVPQPWNRLSGHRLEDVLRYGSANN